MTDWTFTEVDRRISKELSDFLPERIFDAHAHLYRLADLNSSAQFLNDRPGDVSIDTWRERLGRQLGEHRLQGALFIPFPTAGCAIEKVNEFTVSQVSVNMESRGLIAVSPDM